MKSPNPVSHGRIPLHPPYRPLSCRYTLRRLKTELQCKLDLTRIPCRSDEAELRRTQYGRVVTALWATFCKKKVCMIQNVKELSAELQVRTFGSSEILKYREIPDAIARTCDRVTPRAPKRSERRICECASVEHRPWSTWM